MGVRIDGLPQGGGLLYRAFRRQIEERDNDVSALPVDSAHPAGNLPTQLQKQRGPPSRGGPQRFELQPRPKGVWPTQERKRKRRYMTVDKCDARRGQEADCPLKRGEPQPIADSSDLTKPIAVQPAADGDPPICLPTAPAAGARRTKADDQVNRCRTENPTIALDCNSRDRVIIADVRTWREKGSSTGGRVVILRTRIPI